MSDALITELRTLLLRSAPEADLARPVMDCAVHEPLDEIMPFSSMIILGFVVAVEDRFEIRVDREALTRITAESPTLQNLADAIRAMGGTV